MLGLVGKGVTFDTGGISIKPAEGMERMKTDMSGAAAVIGAMRAIALLDAPMQVIGVIPAAENMPGGRAIKPADVLTGAGGKTVEVINTDAEGRLILGDGLWYAKELGATHLVDIATLTGAMKVALGQHTGGYFANDEALAAALRAAGADAGEDLWRFPLVADYEHHLESHVADADNAPRHAGAISAALFLQHFVAGRPWAHVDIASVGDSPGERHEWTTGPTGFGVRMLLRWLTGPTPLEGIG